MFSRHRDEDKFRIYPDELSKILQALSDNIVTSCHDADWNEDYISRQLIEAMRYVMGLCCILPSRWPSTEQPSALKLDFEAYKLTGSAEMNHGDLAVIITKLYPGGGMISGVGFYEAKAADKDGRYPSFSVPQLRRLVTNTPNLSYLLYHKGLGGVSDEDWIDHDLHSSYRGIKNNSVHVRSVNAGILRQRRNPEVAANLVGQSFGYHFVNKLLSGRDLDYSRKPEETIRRWLKVTRSSSPLVVTVSLIDEGYLDSSPQLCLPGFEAIEPEADFIESDIAALISDILSDQKRKLPRALFSPYEA